MEQLAIFCAYVPEDEQLYDELEKHLQNLQREYQLKLWSDILPGADRTAEIDRYFNLASIILLLISPNFVHSDYCKIVEEHIRARQSTERPQHIIPILLRPVDWKYPAVSRLQVLPDNDAFVTSWPHQDEAFLNIAKGIRRVVETLQSPTYSSSATQMISVAEPPSLMKQIAKGMRRVAAMIQSPAYPNPLTATHIISATEYPQLQTDEAQKATSLKNYIYISDMKMMNMLEQQVGWKKEDIAPFQKRYQALHTILCQLEKARKLQPIQSDRNFKEGDYVTGTCPMKWGTVKWDSSVVCFFFAKLSSRIVLMAGSAYHLLGNGQSSKELSLSMNPSSYPGIISALQFAAERNNVKWSRGIGSIPDYLFALAFVQGKFFYELKIQQLATAFPEQKLEFTALVHKTLSPPSTQDIRSFFQSNAINRKDKQEINLMLADASEILICSPVYVSLGQG